VKKLNSLIASRLGVAENEITDAFIRNARANRKTDHDVTNSVIGGRTTHGLEQLSAEKVTSALKSFHHMATEENKDKQ